MVTRRRLSQGATWWIRYELSKIISISPSRHRTYPTPLLGARSTWSARPSVRLVEEDYEGELHDVLEIDADISHSMAAELEDRIWAHMQDASHLRPDNLQALGRFSAGNSLRQSDTLALTQTILLYHVIRAYDRLECGDVLTPPAEAYE